MAKGKANFSLSGLLCDLGDKILFCPPSEFRTASPEENEKKRDSRLLPYKMKVKTALSKMTEQSAVLAAVRGGIRWFLSLKIRSFAVFFFACGFVQILSFFLGSVRGDWGREDNLLFGVVQMLLTLICSFARGDVTGALKRSFLHKGVLGPLVGLHSWQYPVQKSHDGIVWMLLIGLGTGALSFFLSPVWILYGLIFLTVALFLFFCPEAGLVIGAFGGLFLPRTLLYVFACLTLISFVFKCCLGKRSLVLSPMDLLVLLFFLPFLSVGSASPVAGAFFLFFLYFAASGLLRTVDGIGRFFDALCLGGVFLALMMLAREGIALAFPGAFLRFPDLGRLFFVLPTEENGILIAMLCPLLLGQIRRTASVGKRFGSLLSLILCLPALFVVRESNVWLALFVSATVFFVFSFRPGLLIACITGLLTMIAFRLLPTELLVRILSFFGMDAGSLVLSGEREQSFLALLRNGGVIWLLLFASVVLWFFYECVRFCTKTTETGLHPSVLGALCSVTVFCCVTVQELFPDWRALCLVALLLAVPAASRRAAIREEVRLPY
ncbi:MAG: hypothetical protein IKC69_05545 [Clostridia bacterium]|nr:hypothetical protein [Clostridia bacterium]